MTLADKIRAFAFFGVVVLFGIGPAIKHLPVPSNAAGDQAHVERTARGIMYGKDTNPWGN